MTNRPTQAEVDNIIVRARKERAQAFGRMFKTLFRR